MQERVGRLAAASEARATVGALPKAGSRCLEQRCWPHFDSTRGAKGEKVRAGATSRTLQVVLSMWREEAEHLDTPEAAELAALLYPSE